jgi:hypothetical protein
MLLLVLVLSLGNAPAHAGDPEGNFTLPWQPGEDWRMTQGPHVRSTPGKPKNSLDFNRKVGESVEVRAAGPGYVTNQCNGVMIAIDHVGSNINEKNGWRSSYYHLIDTSANGIPKIPNNTFVQRGTVLGKTSTKVDTGGCGGSATGVHTHFSISKFNNSGTREDQEWNGREISGWTVYDGRDGKGSRMEKDGSVVMANGFVHNPKYSVKNVGGKCLDVRNGYVFDNSIQSQIYGCNNTAAQQWRYYSSDGSIRNIEGRCLDVQNGTTLIGGTPVQTFTCNQTLAQKWSVPPNGVTGAIQNHGGLCLDVKDGKTDIEGQPLWIYACNGTAAQKWTFED